MIEASRENLSVNKLVAEKREIIFAEGDMIVPDAKPDILKTISTSGVVSAYKTEVLDEKVRLDGNVNTYIMYMPDGVEDNVRGINTNLDFSENINIPNSKEGMNVILEITLQSIECKVLNGRKISIKATLDVNMQVYSKEDIEIINDMRNVENLQMLKEELSVNSLVGQGENKITAKDTIKIDNIDNLAEILKIDVNIVNKDIKVSYNKVLAKAEAEIKIMYLTEDNRVNIVTSRIPVVGFIDIPNVTEGNMCDVNYLIKNIVIKPNSQEEHSIYIEIEIEIKCNVYEEKNINLIQDMYIPGQKMNFEKKQIMTVTEKQDKKETRKIKEKINLKEIENQRLIDVDIVPSILKEDKINSKILYEGDMNLQFTFTDDKNQINIKEAKIPFEYVIDDLENGENLNTSNTIEIKDRNFVIQDGGDIDCDINMETSTKMYRNANINVIDSIEENGVTEQQDYSIVIYIVKKGDSLWKIAKKFGSTVEAIAKINNINNPSEIYPGDTIFIPKYIKVTVSNYE